MVLKRCFVFCIILSCFLVCAGVLVAQEETKPPEASVPTTILAQEDKSVTSDEPVVSSVGNQVGQAATAETESAMTEVQSEPEQAATEWIWGEVVSVDPDNKQLAIKHLDYDSYEETQTTLKLNDKTLLENVTDLSQIDPGDHITVDYNVVGSDNLASLIVVEKKETGKEMIAVEDEEPVMSKAISVKTDTGEKLPVKLSVSRTE